MHVDGYTARRGRRDLKAGSVLSERAVRPAPRRRVDATFDSCGEHKAPDLKWGLDVKDCAVRL